MKQAVKGASKWLMEKSKRNPIPFKLFKSILDNQIKWGNSRGVAIDFGELSEVVKAELLKGGIYVMSADGKTNKPEYTSASLFAAGEEFYLSPIPALTLSLAYSDPILPKLFGWLCRVFDEASEEGITELRFTVNAVKESDHA